MVYRLHKALYGLKQAPRAWNKKIDQVLIQIGFKKCSVEFGVYVQKLSDGGTIIICMLMIYSSLVAQHQRLRRLKRN